MTVTSALTLRAAEPAGRRPHRARDRCHQRAAAAAHALQRRKGHEQRVWSGKADDLARDILAGRFDHHPRTDRHGVQWAGDFHHQPAHADNAAVDLDTVEFVNLLGQRLHGANGLCVRLVTRNAPVLTLYLPAPLIIALVLGS
jgi:hypothetical protein